MPVRFICPHHPCKKLALACLLALAGVSLGALNLPIKPPADDPNSRLSLSKEFRDPSEVWNIGFASLSAESVSSGNAALSETLPRLWKKALSVELKRYLDEATRNKITTKLRDAAVLKAMEGLSQAIQDRDTAWLQYKLDAQAEAIQAKIDAAHRRLEALRGFDPGWIQLPESRKLAVVAPAADTELFPAVAVDRTPDGQLKDKLQSLVYGHLREDAGYLFLQLSVWDYVQDKAIWTEEWVLDPRNAQERISDQLEAMASSLLGQGTGGLSIACQPKDALVTIRSQAPAGSTGDAAKGIIIAQEPGGGEFRFLTAGDYTIEISREGYVRQKAMVSLAAGATTSQQYELAPSAERFFGLDSQPPGARVYFNNQFLGYTPLQVPVSDARTTIMVQADGFRPQRLVVPADEVPDQMVTLLPDLVNWKSEMADRRNKMFDSLGLFAISIVPPLFLNGLYKNILSTLPDPATYVPSPAMPYDRYMRLADQGIMFYYFGIGSLAFTVAFGVNFAIDLAGYLDAANLASGQ